MRARTLVLSLFFIFSLSGFAAPDFDELEVYSIFSGKIHGYVRNKNEPGNWYWEGLREKMASKSPNFAGHYVTYSGGCGGGAACGEVINVKTGKVVAALPYSFEVGRDNPDEDFGFDFSVNSKLMVVYGVAQGLENDERGNELPYGYRTRYYEFKETYFKLLRVE